MTNSVRKGDSISPPSQSSLGDLSLASVASSSPPVIPNPSKQKALPPSSTLGSPDNVSFNRASQLGSDFVTATMDKRIQNVLLLCEEVVASGVAIYERSDDSADREMVHILDDCLYNLKIWVENVEAAIFISDVSSINLRALDVLKGSAASTVRQIIADLETTVIAISKEQRHDSLTLSRDFRSSCGLIKTGVDQLGQLENELTNEIANQKADVQNELKNQHSSVTRKITVLCLDGGGIRSYSSLLILRALMDEVRSLLPSETAAGEVLRPHEVFDYVFGSSSGGLIAIMLARLNMTDQQCIDTFQIHAESIFLRSRLLYGIFGRLFTTKYSSKSIVRATELVVRSFNPLLNDQKWKRNMFAAPNARCKCGVIAYAVSSNPDLKKNPLRDPAYLDDLRILRTYNNPSGARNPGLATDYQIWQVAQATAAAPSYFPSVMIDGEEFLDGAFGANNPSHLAAKELSTLYDMDKICLVSIGSGGQRITSRNHSSQFKRWMSLLQTAMDSMTDSENVHSQMLVLAKMSEKLSYFRFDVPGLEHIAMDQLVLGRSGKWLRSEKRRTIPFIRAQTQKYLQRPETLESIKSCAQMIVKSRRHQVSSSPRSGQNTTNSIPYQVDDVLVPRNPPAFGGTEDELEITDSVRYALTTFSIPRHRTFCGRNEILETMYIQLGPKSRRIYSRPRTCLLYGSRGIGKTQIAVEYCARHRLDYDCIFWIEASTEVDLCESYRSILKLIKPNHSISDAHTVIQTVNQWLLDTAQWLLVFNDVVNMDDIMRYFPAGSQGSVILTSRNRDVGIPGSPGIEVTPLDLQTGAGLLGCLIKHAIIDSSATYLVDILGGHPLAISFAAEYLNSAASSFGDYLQLFEEIQMNLLDTSYPQRFQSVLVTSLPLLSIDGQKTIECMALMDSHLIFEELFLQVFVPVTEKFRVSRAELLRLYLIEKQTSSLLPAYSMHGVLKNYIIRYLVADRQKYLNSFTNAVLLIRGIIPHLTPYSHQEEIMVHQALFRRYISYIVNLNETDDHYFRMLAILTLDLNFAEVLSDFVSYLFYFPYNGSDHLARRLCEKTIKIRVSALGEEHPDTLASKFNMASILERQGESFDAYILLTRVEKKTTHILGPKHPQTLITQLRLASMTMNEEDVPEDIPDLRHTIDSMTIEFGPYHPYTLEGMGKLSLARQLQGQWQEAEKLSELIFQKSCSTLGRYHPDTLTSQHQLAVVYRGLGKLEMAEKLALEALKSRREILGPIHPDTLTSLASLVLVYRDMGKLKEADELAREVFSARMGVLGPAHPSTISSRGDLALIERDQDEKKSKLEDAPSTKVGVT